MKNRNRNHKKDAKWPHGRPPGWEVHHIDRNPKNGGGNTICLPREVHIDIDKGVPDIHHNGLGRVGLHMTE